MAEFNVVTHKDCEIIDITREINERVPAGLECGICHIFCPHTTAGITVNENADPDVKRDMLAKLDELVQRRTSESRAARFFAGRADPERTAAARDMAGNLFLRIRRAAHPPRPALFPDGAGIIPGDKKTAASREKELAAAGGNEGYSLTHITW